MSAFRDVLDPGGLLEKSEDITGIADPILSAGRSLETLESGDVEGFFADPSGLGNLTAGSNAELLESDSFREARDPLDLFGGRGERAADAAAGEQETAALAAIAEERRGRAAGQEFLEPFGGVGARAVEQSSFLANPQEQFDFLQGNPLFDLALENANRQTSQAQASKGRFSAGDTLTALSNNVLLSAQPLIDRQRQDIGNLLNLGSGVAQTQANVAIGEGTNVGGLLTDIGNVKSSGIIAGQQAKQQGADRAIGLGLAAFSDSRLKENVHIVGEQNGYNIYEWKWNKKAGELFDLHGTSKGVMWNEVAEKNPEAVEHFEGFGKVNYGMIGVPHAA